MRLLACIPDGYPTFRPDVAALFGRYLPRQGVFTDLVTQHSEKAALPSSWEAGRLFLCTPATSRMGNQFRMFWHDVIQLFRAKAADYDAIQVRDKVFAAVIALWVARSRGLPLFYWMSFPMSERYIAVVREEGFSVGPVRWAFLALKGYLGKALIYRYVLPRCAQVFVQSERMLEDLVAQGIARERMTPVPMGVDLERSMPTQGAAAQPRFAGKRVIAYLGTFDRPRKLEFLLDAVAALATDIPDLVLLMVGDGPLPADRERLQQHARTLGIADHIHWTGWVSSDEAWQWMRCAELAVSLFPRGDLLDSASPTKVVEYLALGIPVVANDQPDQRMVLEQSGAGLCCPMEPAAFAGAIRTLLLDAGLRRRMGAAGPPYVRARRTYAILAERVALVYRLYEPRPSGA